MLSVSRRRPAGHDLALVVTDSVTLWRRDAGAKGNKLCTRRGTGMCISNVSACGRVPYTAGFGIGAVAFGGDDASIAKT